MERTVRIDNIDVKMKADAWTPFLFKEKFGEDVIKGVLKMKTMKEDGGDITFLAKIAWTMAKQADDNIPELKEWLSQFSFLAIQQASPDIVGLWIDNEKQASKARKK